MKIEIETEKLLEITNEAVTKGMGAGFNCALIILRQLMEELSQIYPIEDADKPLMENAVKKLQGIKVVFEGKDDETDKTSD